MSPCGKLAGVKLARRRALGLALAACAAPWLAARAANMTDVAEPVIALNDGLVAAMKAGTDRVPFPKRFAALEPVVDRGFDLPGILRISIGPRFDTLAAPDRATLGQVFKNFTVASYVANFDKYSGERFDVLPQIRSSGADFIVQTRINSMSGDTQKIDYQMRETQEGWRAVDVLLDGAISRVAVQRSDFRSLLNGGDAAPLIQSLREKVADLSGGTIPT